MVQYSRFRRPIQKAGLPEMSFHDLRHMNASIMVALGIPDKYAMERGGWSSNGTLQNVYQHTFSEERENVDDRIDDFFRKIR
jgi:integrase